ncbi:hypothetical protein ADUPG1_008341 [Aduncisulcus paluster]|uniref:Uncharacterized protein n=1 Tax=Aduncisulcus paluster TaxID=2918883 RepID=A0ABQ5KRL4_9EUKA|nr:hypothetical protein ADUPG1_008341 [Aduncisulcus paluster]
MNDEKEKKTTGVSKVLPEFVPKHRFMLLVLGTNPIDFSLICGHVFQFLLRQSDFTYLDLEGMFPAPSIAEIRQLLQCLIKRDMLGYQPLRELHICPVVGCQKLHKMVQDFAKTKTKIQLWDTGSRKEKGEDEEEGKSKGRTEVKSRSTVRQEKVSQAIQIFNEIDSCESQEKMRKNLRKKVRTMMAIRKSKRVEAKKKETKK